MQDKQKLEEFLSRTQYMTIAVTLDDGTPWAVSVRILHREGNVFEWDSKTDTEHSKAIAMRPTIAISMFEKVEDRQFGVYAQADAMLMRENEHGVGRYKAVTKDVWVNDETFIKRRVDVGGGHTT